MKFSFQQKNRGFTLIETMVSVFILTLAFVGLLSLNAESLFSSRYARNEITANYLLQEAADHIRNDRDTTAFLGNDPDVNTGWVNFLNKYGYNGGATPGTCFAAFSSTSGCYFEPADSVPTVSACNTAPDFGVYRCPVLNYDPDATNNDFYTYKNPSGTYVKSVFKRQVVMAINTNNADELDVKITVEWQNGTLVRSRSLVITLLNWQKQ